MKKITLAFGLILSLSLSAAVPSVVWHVDAASPGGSGLLPTTAFRTIQEAVDVAHDGDVVEIAAGVYREQVTVADKRLTLRGAGRDLAVIDAEKAGRPLTVTGAAATGSVVEKVRLLNGQAAQGGGLYVQDATRVDFVDGAIVCCGTPASGDGAAVNGPVWIIRSLIDRCDTPTADGVQRGVVAGILGAANSVFLNNGHLGNLPGSQYFGCSVTAKGTYGPFVNCNFVHNFGTIHPDSDNAYSSYKFRNCLSLGVDIRAFRQAVDCQYCAQTTYGSMKNNAHNFGGDKNNGTTITNEKFLLEPFQIISTFDDWRLRPESELVDQGNKTELDKVPEEYRATDYYGQTRVQGGEVDIGVAEGTVQPTAGVVRMDSISSTERNLATNLYCNGHRMVNAACNASDYKTANIAYFGSADPGVKAVSLVCGDPNKVFAVHNGIIDPKSVNQSTPNGCPFCYFPDLNGRISFALPQTGVYTNKILAAAGVVYVDAAADAATADGSEAHPYRTLQAAVNAAANQSIVRAKAGTYDEGGSQGVADSDNICSTSNRVYISKSCHLIGEGPDKTFIVGRKVVGDERLKGCGPGAMRCVQVNLNGSFACVTGFALTGGATDCDPVGKAKPGKGGNQVSRGNFAGGGFQGRPWASGVHYSATLQNCVVSNNVAYFGAGVYNGICKNVVFADNSLVNYDLTSNVTVSASTGAAAHEGVLASCVVLPNDLNGLGWACWANYGTDSARTYFYRTSFAPIDFGSRTSGAKARLYDCLLSGGGGGTPSATLCGTVTTAAGQEDPDTLRPYVGSPVLTAPGTDDYPEAIECYFALPMDVTDASELGAGAKVGAYAGSVQPPNLYVNPSGDDANGGLTPATPKQTLVGVMAIACPGSVVHAAAGEYRLGSERHTTPLYSPVTVVNESRVVIPPGVSLVADEGPETTFIVGAKASSPDTYGRGEDAVRCVVMYENTRLKGFTVKNGYTTGGASTVNENMVGAGILGATSAKVEDCVITACACRTGVVCGPDLIRCQILDVIGTSNNGGALKVSCVNCYFDGCSDGVIGDWRSLVGCTFGPGNRLWTRTGGLLNTAVTGGANPVRNCLFLTPLSGKATNTFSNVKNSVFLDAPYYAITGGEAVQKLSAADMKLADDGVSLTKDSPAVDAGDDASVDADGAAGDAARAPRVQGTHVDVGAFEYDPKGDMAAVLAKKNVVVQDAAVGTARLADAVLLTQGALTARFTRLYDGCKCGFAVEVTGNGVLVVTDASGRELGRYAKADGPQALSVVHTGSAVTADFIFTYVAADGDASDVGARLSNFETSARGLVFVVH